MAKAAQEMNISQPAISVTIKDLEREFGIRLFLRINKKLVLTEEGIEFRRMASELVYRADYMEQYFHDKANGRQKINLGISFVYDNLLSPSIYAFSERNPNIELTLYSFGDGEMERLLDTDTVDLFVKGTSAVDDLSGFNSKDVVAWGPRFYTYKGNPLAQQESVDPKDLTDEPIVVFSERLNHRKLLDNLKIMLPGLQLNNIVAYTNQMNTVSNIISAEKASVIICKGAVPMTENMVERPLLDAKSFHITAIWKKNRFLSTAAIKLLNSLELYISV